MTQIAIQAQIAAIKSATKDALKSKESARKFLADAGISVKRNSTNKNSSTKKGR